jgi:hypothetical protein
MRTTAILLGLLLATTTFGATFPIGSPATTNNDDSCDIAVQPAATLLLPYFEVDFQSQQSTARTTLFTIQNVSSSPQIANVTVWTDWGYPALTFPIFLTGYDVQGINLYDVFSRAIIAPGPTPGTGGTSSNVVVPANPTPGSQPGPNTSNPNFLSDVSKSCAVLPGTFVPALLRDLQLLFTVGVPEGNSVGCPPPPQTVPPTPVPRMGGVHHNAIGYITIDVVATCTPTAKPMSKEYFGNVLLYDNVLSGDYQVIVPGAKSYAQGGPLVHIRAIPEGGPAGASTLTNLPYTFYDRYTTGFFFNRAVDRRQPLPSTFAPRFIQSGASGFNTSLKLWREGFVSGDAGCLDFVNNSNITIAEVVRFDEHENATASVPFGPPPLAPQVPATSSVSTATQVFPPLASVGSDVGGWIYMDLNNGGSTAYSVNITTGIARDFRTNTSVTTGLRQSQNWVITSMFADPTFATEATALQLGNACTPAPPLRAQIGPAANPTP